MSTAWLVDAAADPDTNAAYRLGGASAIVLAASYLVIVVLYALAGAPPSGGEGWLDYLAGNTAAWWGIVGLSVLTDFLFLPLSVSLCIALKSVDRVAILVGTGLLAMFAVLDLAITWPNFAALITLSGDLAVATNDAQRAMYVAAASYPAAVLASGLFPVYVILVPALGILIIGLVMLKGSFSRLNGYLGVATGMLGVVAVVGPWFVPSLGFVVILTSVLTTVWVFLAGYRLLRLGRGTPGQPGSGAARRPS